jgi:hypothetical protein
VILFWENGRQILGDMLHSACLRSDLSPVPVTLELDVRMSPEVEPMTREGKAITLASGEALQVVKRQKVSLHQVQDDRLVEGVRITAIQVACLPVAFARSRAIIKENTTLASIYRAVGASLRSINADFPVSRFTCLVGETPSFHIRRILQEEAGTVRWKNGRLEFFRLRDLFRQTPVATVPMTTVVDTQSGFLERHSVPNFFTVNSSGVLVFGACDKARVMAYSPEKSLQRLNNMTVALVNRAPVSIPLNTRLAAGDLFNTSTGESLVAITVVHTFQAADGNPGHYTRLFLGSLES